MSQTERLARLLFAGFILSTLAVLAVTYWFIDEVTAIKGGYVLLGVLIAAGLYVGRDGPVASNSGSDHLVRWSTKMVVILAGTAYLVAYMTGTRLWAVVAALGVGYALLGYQVAFVGTTRGLLPQVAVLYTVSPVSKYLSTGFYYGETDLLRHVRAIEVLYRTGRLDAIGSIYATYDAFPALHILSGAIGAFTGLPAYDAVIVLGILTYAVATFTIYYLFRSLLSPSRSLAITIVFSTLSVVQNFATYFFPQALATAFIFFLFYTVVRRESVANRYSLLLSSTALLIAGALTFAHHVTQILFAGIVAVIYAPSLLRTIRFGRELRVNNYVPRAVPILFAMTAGLTHLVVSQTAIVDYSVEFARTRLADPFVSGIGGQRATVGLGTEIPYHTPEVALRSLFHVDGVYFIGLTALFVIGAVSVILSIRQYTPILGVVLLGLGSALTVLKVPIINTLSRLSLPLSLFFAFIAGAGLWRVVARARTPDDIAGANSLTAERAAVIGLVVLLGVTGPLVAADDLYGLHRGPNLWETYSTPEQQVEFSQQELYEFETLTRHADRYDPDITMLWVSREMSGRFGGRERSAPMSISQEGIRANGALAYRTRWTEHQVGYTTDRSGTLYIADWWLSREIGATNKVYTTGRTGIVWEREVFLTTRGPGVR